MLQKVSMQVHQSEMCFKLHKCSNNKTPAKALLLHPYLLQHCLLPVTVTWRLQKYYIWPEFCLSFVETRDGGDREDNHSLHTTNTIRYCQLAYSYGWCGCPELVAKTCTN